MVNLYMARKLLRYLLQTKAHLIYQILSLWQTNILQLLDLNPNRMLSSKIQKKYQSIKLLERYRNLSNTFKSTENLADVNPEKVLGILHELDPGFKFFKSESFFGLTQQSDDFVSKCNFSIKYGVVESIFWVKDLIDMPVFSYFVERLESPLNAFP